MSVIPEKFVLESTMSRKQVINRLEKKMVKYTPSMNVLSTGRFMREHKEESIYYGECSGSKVKLFHPRAKTRDGGTTGAFGTITETETGCTITGHFRKPLYAYISTLILVLLCLLCAVGTYAGGSWQGALVFLGIGAAGAVLMLADAHKKYVKSCLEELTGK